MVKIEIKKDNVYVINTKTDMYVRFKPIENGNYYVRFTGVIYENMKINDLVSLIVGVINE